MPRTLRSLPLRSVLVLAAAAALGCGGSSEAPTGTDVGTVPGDTASAPTHVEGTLVGGSLTPPVTAVSRPVTGGLEVIIVDADLDCTRVAKDDWVSQLPGGTFVLRLLIAGTTATRYEITRSTPASGTQAQARWSLAASPPSPEQRAAAGSITLAAVSADSVAGTFELAFTDAGDATGGFRAVTCSM